MWTWQRILKISWTEKVTNEKALVRANEARSILKMNRHRKHRWLGHVLRHENFLHDITDGKTMDKATCSRKRMELLRDYGQLKDSISDRSRWRQESKTESMSETCWKQQKTKKDVIWYKTTGMVEPST